MGTKTANYRLHQWAPEDAFLRTDFNEDMQLIDAGMLQAKTAGQTAATQAAAAQAAVAACETRWREALAPVAYNSYQNTLLNMLSKRHLSSPRALLFDGFQNDSRIAATEPGCDYDTGSNTLKIFPGQASVAGSFGHALGSDSVNPTGGKAVRINAGDSNGIDWTPSGCGTLTKVTFRLGNAIQPGYTSQTSVSVEVYRGTTLLSTSQTLVVSERVFRDFTFNVGARLAPKRAMRVVLRCAAGGGQIMMSYGKRPDSPYDYLLPTLTVAASASYTSGAMESVESNLGGDYDQARAYVRHIGGSVELAVKGPAGGWTAMAAVGTRDSLSLRTGELCKETEFRLATPPAKPNRLVKARLTLRGSDVEVHDYAIMFS